MTIVLFILMFGLMLLGLPIAYSIGLSSLSVLNLYDLGNMLMVPQKLFGGLDSFILLAVPLFMLTGSLLETCGLSQRLIEWVNCICGNIIGSVGVVTIISSAIFAALIGSGPATIAAIGALMLPALKESGYSDHAAAGIVTAGGTLGPIIPPSVGMIVYGANMGVSIPKMFAAAVVPGFLMALGMIIVNFGYVHRAHIRPVGIHYTLKEKIRCTWRALPVLMLPVIILGGIYGGIFTPTEAAVVAVTYSLILGFSLRELTIKELKKNIVDTIIISGSMNMIMFFSNLFGYVLAAGKIPQTITEIMVPLIKSPMMYLLILMLLMLLVGALMDTITAIIILAPILVPIGTSMGLDPLRIAMVFCITLIIGIVTPPFGVSLFAVSSITGMPFNNVVKGTMPYIISILIVVLLIVLFPPLTMWLPSIIYG